MKYKKNFKYLIFIYFLFYLTPTQAENKIFYINIEYLVNNSLAGKSINTQLIKKDKKNVDKFKKIEKDLINEKSEIIAQKNILNDEEYKKKVVLFEKKVSDFNTKKEEALKDFKKEKINAHTLLIDTLSPILAKYAKDNLAAMIIDKKNIVIGKTELDITQNILKILDTEIKTIKIKQ